jgi:hypothetical protein
MNHGQFDKHTLVAAVHNAEGGIIAGFRAAQEWVAREREH